MVEVVESKSWQQKKRTDSLDSGREADCEPSSSDANSKTFGKTSRAGVTL